MIWDRTTASHRSRSLLPVSLKYLSVEGVRRVWYIAIPVVSSLRVQYQSMQLVRPFCQRRIYPRTQYLSSRASSLPHRPYVKVVNQATLALIGEPGICVSKFSPFTSPDVIRYAAASKAELETPEPEPSPLNLAIIEIGSSEAQPAEIPERLLSWIKK